LYYSIFQWHTKVKQSFRNQRNLHFIESLKDAFLTLKLVSQKKLPIEYDKNARHDTTNLTRLYGFATTSLTRFVPSLCCAYGPYTTFPALASAIAFIFTNVGVFGCTLFTSVPITASGSHITGGMGLWKAQGIQFTMEKQFSGLTYVCYPYSSAVANVSNYLDGPMKFGRAVSVLAAIVAALTWLAILFLCCMNFGERLLIFNLAMGGSIFVAVCLLLELVCYIELCYLVVC
jgi:hypothetical protein